jgi:hypothetical protein
VRREHGRNLKDDEAAHAPAAESECLRQARGGVDHAGCVIGMRGLGDVQPRLQVDGLDDEPGKVSGQAS